MVTDVGLCREPLAHGLDVLCRQARDLLDLPDHGTPYPGPLQSGGYVDLTESLSTSTIAIPNINLTTIPTRLAGIRY